MSEVFRRTFLASSAAVGLLDIPGSQLRRSGIQQYTGAPSWNLSAKWSTLLASSPRDWWNFYNKTFPISSHKKLCRWSGAAFLLVLKSDKAVTITINDLPAKRRL